MSGTIKIVSRHFSETQSLIKHWNVFFSVTQRDQAVENDTI